MHVCSNANLDALVNRIGDLDNADTVWERHLEDSLPVSPSKVLHFCQNSLSF